jgi:hypothetical protein
MRKSETWIDSQWRPTMGWVYIAICVFDFMAAPILWSILQATVHGTVTSQWDPITLKGAGLFHLAMGTILGVTSYGRTREKMASMTAGFGVDNQIIEQTNTTEIESQNNNK